MIKLDNDINDITTFIEFIGIERNYINSLLDKQNEYKKIVFNNLKNTIDFINNQITDENIINNVEKSTKLMVLINKSIFSLNNLINKLQEIELNPSFKTKKDIKIIENQLEEYNIICSSTFSDILINNNSIEFFIRKNVKAENDIMQDENHIDSDVQSKLNINYPEKTLMISEIDNKVFLPYINDEIISILQNPNLNFKSEQEIIDRYYTLPCSYYKFPAFSRFKETYKLAREKEKKSVSQSLELAMEMFSNYSLHPAIITACKNLNQLDVYLSCLEYNELEDFTFFKIIFKTFPTKIKNTLKDKGSTI